MMKKRVLFLLFSLIIADLQSQTTRQDLRNSFLRAIDKRESLDSLKLILENKNNRTFLEDSYLGICYALYANYAEGNFAKLKYVWKAHKLLNKSVSEKPNDPEPRFFRFMLEHHLPSFLGLNKDIPHDLNIIFTNQHFLDDNIAMKKKAIEFLLWTNRCNQNQSALLKAQLSKL